MKVLNNITTSASAFLFILFLNSKAFAVQTTNITEKTSTSIRPVIQNMYEVEQVKDAEAYFRTMRKNAKQLKQVEVISDEEYRIVFRSFTNLVNQPISLDDKNSPELLDLRSLAVEDFIRQKQVRRDDRVWMALAQYIGNIRSQLPPPRPSASSSKEFVMPSSTEEWEQGRKIGNYQLALKHENMSLTSSLSIYLKNLKHEKSFDMNFVDELMELAKFTKEEKKEILVWFNEK